MVDLRKILWRRFGEILFMEIFLSAVVMTLVSTSIFETWISLASFTAVCALIYFIFHFFFLRATFYFIRSRRAYYTVNLAAYALFALLSVVTYLICYFNDDMMMFTWMFAVTKFWSYLFLEMSGFVSMILFHIMMVSLVYIAPAEMYRNPRYNKP